MPVRNSLSRSVLPGEDQLRGELEAEMRAPRADGEPVIIVERPNPTTVHLYAIWSRFQGLEQTVRSRIILDAFAHVHGEPEAVRVTLSMGLTPEEARQMGIS
jgi:hypothetical protein